MQKIIEEFLEAKRAESLAIAKRVELGDLIAKELGTPDEGSKSHTVDGYKVTVKQPINRKIDWAVWNELEHGNRPQPCVLKPSLDLEGLRWVQENLPDYYLELSRAITATPGRVQIEIKELDR